MSRPEAVAPINPGPQLRPTDRGTHERDPQGRVLRQPPIRDLAPNPDRPRGHGGGTGAAQAGTWREIITHGGTKFARSLIRLGLVEEYRLWVLPAAVGQGAPLFTELARPVTLSLVKNTAFPSGILELCYEPAGHGA
jgi:hypothetical protein